MTVLERYRVGGGSVALLPRNPPFPVRGVPVVEPHSIHDPVLLRPYPIAEGVDVQLACATQGALNCGPQLWIYELKFGISGRVNHGPLFAGVDYLLERDGVRFAGAEQLRPLTVQLRQAEPFRIVGVRSSIDLTGSALPRAIRSRNQ